MTDMQIIKQLLNGYHLDYKELEVAMLLVARLNNELNSRIN